MTNGSCEKNDCIRCTVEQCRYHCHTEDYCSLPNIQVGTHEQNPTMPQCTDCMSFQAK